jgi:hypothetical protein
LRRVEWNTTRHAAGIARRPSGRIRTNPAADLGNHTRWALLNDPGRLTATRQQLRDRLRRARHLLFRAWALNEELRDRYRLPPGRRAGTRLDTWLARACRCRIPAMVACPSEATVSSSWPPFSWACPTATSKASTPRSGSSATAATVITAPPLSPP